MADPIVPVPEANPPANPIPDPVNSVAPIKNGPSREADIAKAAEMGQKRAEREAAIKQKIKDQRSDEEKKAQALQLEATALLAQRHEEKKDYRKNLKAHEREMALEKEKKAKQEKLAAEEKLERDKKRKEEQAYLHELHDTAALKIAKQQREYAIEKEHVASLKKAEQDKQAAYLAAEAAERSSNTEVERETRDRKGVLANETRTKLYQLEGLKKLRIHEMENQMASETAAAKKGTTSEQTYKHAALDQLSRAKKRRIDTEIADKHAAILQEEIGKKAAIDTEAGANRGAASAERVRSERYADRLYSNALNDIDRAYKQAIIDNNVGK